MKSFGQKGIFVELVVPLERGEDGTCVPLPCVHIGHIGSGGKRQGDRDDYLGGQLGSCEQL